MYILSVAGLLTGCSSDDVTEIVDDTPQKIAFKISDNWQQGSRALITNADQLQDRSFAVLGKYSSGDVYNASALSEVFNNQEVSYNSTDKWNYQPIQRWQANSIYRFCAYWPMREGTTLTGDLNSTITLNSFRGEQTAANQIDLFVSDVVSATIGDPRSMSDTPGNVVSDGINLYFRHVLCNVLVSVKKAATSNIIVTGVHLLHTPNKGNLTLSSSDNGSTWNSKVWDVDPDEDEMVDYYSGKIDGVTLTDDYQTIWGDGFIVIPQTVNTDPDADENTKVIIRVDFTSDKSGVPQQKSYDVEVPSSPAWEINKKIRYQLTIDENDYIKFGTPIIESWGTSQASGTIIIK